jgi:hypothetical protein
MAPKILSNNSNTETKGEYNPVGAHGVKLWYTRGEVVGQLLGSLRHDAVGPITCRSYINVYVCIEDEIRGRES